MSDRGRSTDPRFPLRKRALALAGGGPAAGLSVGALKRFQEDPYIDFDVWSAACIGAWTMIAYNTAPLGREIPDTVSFLRRVFRPDAWYERFPVATVFTPDFGGLANSVLRFMTNPDSYRNLVVPSQILDAMESVASFAGDPRQWSAARFNDVMFNAVLAPNPLMKFWTSLIYQSPMTGLSRVDYPDNPLLENFDFNSLYDPGKPILYHNAYNLDRQKMEIFCNRYSRYNHEKSRNYGPISGKSLAACSALPYIEEPVELGGERFCEGAVLETVNLTPLLDDHPDLDEIWVSRLLDTGQVKPPENLYDSLNNLVMLFAASNSQRDVEWLKSKIRERGMTTRVIDLAVSTSTCFDWTYSNLENSIQYGYEEADRLMAKYWQETAGDIEEVG